MSEIINRKKIAKNTVLLYTRMLFNMAVVFYTSRILLNILGIENYGVYNVIGGVIALFSFLNGSLAGATSRFITIDLGKGNISNLSKTFSAAFLCHLIIGAIIVILAETIGFHLLSHKIIIPVESRNAATWVFHFSVISAFLTMTQIPYNACIIAHERMNAYAYIGITETLLKLLVVFLLKHFHSSNILFWYGLLTLWATLFTTMCYRFYCHKFFSECKLRFSFNAIKIKQLFLYAGWDLIGNCSIVAQGQGLNVLLNIFFGPGVNAARAISIQVSGAVGQFCSNFMMAVRPQIIKSYAINQIKEMIDLVYSSAKYGFILSLFLVIPLTMEADYILTLWLHDVPKYSVKFSQILLAVTLINVWRNPFVAALHATGKIKLANMLCGTILVSTLPISYLALKKGAGPTSVFWITLSITGLVVLIELLNIKRLLPISLIRYFTKVVLPCLFTTTLVVLSLTILKSQIPESLLRLILSTSTSSLELCIVSYLFILDNQTKNKIKDKIKTKISFFSKRSIQP